MTRWGLLVTSVVAVLVVSACAAEPAPAPSAETPASAPVSGTATATPSAPGKAARPKPSEPTDTARSTPPRDPLAEAVENLEPVEEQVIGADISWPQCPKGMGIAQKRSQGSPLPVDAARYVVIGLTNGPGFYPNPCLADQVDYVRERGLMGAAYAVASYPAPDLLAEHSDSGPYDGTTRRGALSNVGYAQAEFNIASMRRADFATPIVWIDVEPVPDFEWSSDRAANAAVVLGLARGYRDAGYAIGVYSTPYLWEGVVGDLQLGVPEWRAAGQTSIDEALARCGDDWVIQGGQAVLGQWVQDGRDMNVTCPGVSGDLTRWFHQY